MNSQKGLIKLLVLIVIAIIILGYFRVDLRQVIESEMVQRNFHYVWDNIVSLWQQYLATPASYVWDKVIIGLIWNNFRLFVERWQA
jgi:hypothetical protein